MEKNCTNCPKILINIIPKTKTLFKLGAPKNLIVDILTHEISTRSFRKKWAVNPQVTLILAIVATVDTFTNIGASDRARMRPKWSD